MISEQKIRACLFYLSVFIFLVGLPFILSFSLGYKFDTRNFKFTKTGIIVIKTQPLAASVYLDNSPLRDKTPVTINELLPGRYNLRIELEQHYPWTGEAEVNKGKVTRLEKIILFPLRPNIKQLNKERLSIFWIDELDKTIYYINQDDNIIYTSNPEGESYKQIAPFLPITPPPEKFKISEDKQKLLYFSKHQVAVAYLASNKKNFPQEAPFVLNYPADTIVDVFWHSDSYHLILITYKKIQVLEARPGSETVELVSLAKKNSSVYYDVDTDALYFTDYQKADDGNFYNNLYKIDLNTKALPLRNLINIEKNE
jgi:hypothetical protein